MSDKTVIFRILRFKPNHIDPPRFQDYPVEIDANMSVLDGLEKIRLEQDNTLMYRHSCHHSSCGTCACIINGKERLTCITKIKDLEGNVVTLTPLEHFKPLGDLVVDMTSFYDCFDEDWSYLTLVETEGSTPTATYMDRYQRFENCIECGACISACPITPQNKGFLGPAVLAAANNELKKSPQKAGDLLSLAGGRNGEKPCERALNCRRVCPTGVYPARHIADLRRKLERR